MNRAQYQKFAKVDAHHWWFQARRHIVDSILRSLWGEKANGRKVLDIGTGTGGFVPVLARCGHLTATEPDHETLALTRQSFENLSESVSFREGGWEELDLPLSHFDLVTAFDVLEHCQDDRKALTRWKTWLQDGGTLLLTVPAFPSLWGLNDEISHHYRRYTKASLLEALADADFVVKKISYINMAMFIPVWISRNIKDRIQRRFSKEETPVPSDFDVPPQPINLVLEKLFSCESGLLKHVDLPWGTSLLALAQKKGS